MASSAGSSGVFKISQTDGSEAAVAEVRSYSFDVTADTIEKSVMGDTSREYLAGLSSSTLSVEVYWDQSDQDAFDERATVYWELYPTGTGTGEKYYHGSGIVTGKTISAAFDGMVEASFSIQNSGAVTEATA
jgi:predicted secreted protein